MQIVIDISEDICKDCKNCGGIGGATDIETVGKAIA